MVLSLVRWSLAICRSRKHNFDDICLSSSGLPPGPDGRDRLSERSGECGVNEKADERRNVPTSSLHSHLIRKDGPEVHPCLLWKTEGDGYTISPRWQGPYLRAVRRMRSE